MEERDGVLDDVRVGCVGAVDGLLDCRSRGEWDGRLGKDARDVTGSLAVLGVFWSEPRWRSRNERVRAES